MNLRNGTADLRLFLEEWHYERHLARTDLLWLCNEVLGYTLISDRVHGPILEGLQKVRGAREFHKTTEDLTAAFGGKVLWEPLCQMELLQPNVGQGWWRQMLLLYPRGHAKSTLATIAFVIQWILNYPNVRILLTTATETLVT